MGSDAVIHSRMDCCPVGSMEVEGGGGEDARAADCECTCADNHGGKMAPVDEPAEFRWLWHLEHHQAWQVVERVPSVWFEVVAVLPLVGWLVQDLY